MVSVKAYYDSHNYIMDSSVVVKTNQHVIITFLDEFEPQIKAEEHPIPENDIWIAACTMAHGLTVVTADKHFSCIKDIVVENRS